jgi:putative YphP/YqiW family bacilliredoxin
MPYPEFMVTPMRKDLTEAGFRELRTPEDVDT